MYFVGPLAFDLTADLRCSSPKRLAYILCLQSGRLTLAFISRGAVVGGTAVVRLLDGDAVGFRQLWAVHVYNDDDAVRAVSDAAVWRGPVGVVRPGATIQLRTCCRL